MRKTVFALAAATLLSAAFFATAQAAPIAPPTGANDVAKGQVTQVWYHYHHRHCWRGRWGHLHCGW